MMVFTTLFIAVILVALLSLLFWQAWCPAWGGYAASVIVGVACLFSGGVHFTYIGIEVIGLGCLVVWLRHRFWPNRPSAK
jgi:hypothetical protein